ncbi:hypothetical protein FGO68_gene1907 [Halteria grandinella]|uniref:Phosphatidylinositol-glycan-specific phospholipase D n=1 Tax=Halteria grandinella TaxID=5974 RepID=A0A8J8P3E4_HALGN|nr:hypothetical protein FGO68_gene1907 [Halteria grandinella]
MIIAVTIALLCALVSPAGMLVHMDVSDRALHAFAPQNTSYPFKQALLRHRAYLQAASPFADWGYLCQSPAGEESHWPPFIEAYYSYMNSTYEKGSEKYDQMLAFLFGIVSHVQADVPWHWGRTQDQALPQGFLNAMSHDGSECHDDWFECHTTGDVGADFYIAARGNLQFINETWKYPTKDLVKIYHSMNLTKVTEGQINTCNGILFGGSILEKYLSGAIRTGFEKKASFLTEELDLWYHGGIEDLGQSVQQKWNYLVAMIVSNNFTTNQTEGNLGNDARNTSFQKKCEIHASVELFRDNMEKYSRLLGIESIEQEGNYELRVNQFDYQKVIEELEKDLDITIGRQEILLGKAKSVKRLEPFLEFKGADSLQYFGKSMALGDFTGTGAIEIAIGAPGYQSDGVSQRGAVYLESLTASQSVSDNAPRLLSISEYQRFGFSLASLDLNHDGIDDLAVSAPAFTPHEEKQANFTEYYNRGYHGRVYIYLGRQQTGLPDQPDYVISADSETFDISNIGLGLRASDCDGDGWDDLLVLSPLAQNLGDQRGHIAVLTNLNVMHSNGDIEFEQLQIQIKGEQNYEWFGFDAVCHGDLLFVGAPGHRADTLAQAHGAVYIYNINKDQQTDLYTSQQVLLIQGVDEQGKLGYSLDFAYDTQRNFGLLAIGAPGRSPKGAILAGGVYLFKINIDSIQSSSHIGMIRTNSHPSRLGKYLRFYSEGTAKHLIVSAPSYTPPKQISVATEQGMVYIFHDILASIPDDSNEFHIKADEANSSFTTDERMCRHGDTLVVYRNILAVGSPLCMNTGMRNSGRVYLLDAGEAVQPLIKAII